MLCSPDENSLYDSIHVRSEKIRVVVMRTRGSDSWRVHSENLDTRSPENVLLENLCLHTRVDILGVDDRFRPNFNIQINIPVVSMRFTQNVYARVLQIYRTHLREFKRREQEMVVLAEAKKRRTNFSSSSFSNLHQNTSSGISVSSSVVEEDSKSNIAGSDTPQKSYRTSRGVQARREVQLEALVLALENTEQSMRTAADVDTLAQKTDLKLHC